MTTNEQELKNKVAERFNNIADMWLQRGMPAPDRLEPVLAGLACQPGDLVLDAGCGTGNWSAALALQNYRVRGTDLSPKMIENAKTKAIELNLTEKQVSYQVGDAENISFEANTFDGIICFNVLDFAPNPVKALQGFWRVLKPGKRLVMTNLGAYSPVKQTWWKRFLPEETNISNSVGNHILLWEMENLLLQLGWQIIDGQPNFSPTLEGTPNPYQEVAKTISDKILLMTICSNWRFVCIKP
jgi:ubiquinone/menaquinone biosynthesis C-methylase UbiE